MRQPRGGIVLLALAALALFALARHPATPRAATTLPLPGRPLAIAIDADTNRAFIADGANRIDVLDTTTNTLVRSVALNTRPLGLLIDARSQHVLALGAPRGGLSVLDARSGLLLSTTGPRLRPLAMAVDARAGRAFIAGDDSGQGEVSMFDTRSGALLHTVGGAASSPHGVMLSPVNTVGDGPIGVDEAAGRVFAVGERVTMLDARSGRVLRTIRGQPSWTEPWSPKPWAIAIVPSPCGRAGGNVFVGDSSATTLIDATTGRIVRTIRVGVSAEGLAADARTCRVFATTADDTGVRVLDSRDGRVIRTVSVGTLTGAIAVDATARRNAPDGRVFVATLSGVRVLNARTGRVDRTMRTGSVPGAIAVDARTGRAYVIPEPLAGLDGIDGIDGSSVGPIDGLVSTLRRWFPLLPRPVTRDRANVVVALDPAA